MMGFHFTSTWTLLPVTELGVALALVIAAVLGALLGLERSLAGKQAGMRTYALVALGSALFTAVGVLASARYGLFGGAIDPLRVAASVVVGIGFIGAGLAALRGEHAELTTAAGIWLAAGVGMACGLGLYFIALASTLLGVTIFSLFLKVENALRRAYGTSAE